MDVGHIIATIRLIATSSNIPQDEKRCLNKRQRFLRILYKEMKRGDIVQGRGLATTVTCLPANR